MTAANPSRKLGIIAGGGPLPSKIVSHCRATKRDFAVLNVPGMSTLDFDGITMGSTGHLGSMDFTINFRQLTSTVDILKKLNCEVICVAGTFPSRVNLGPESSGPFALGEGFGAELEEVPNLEHDLCQMLERSGFAIETSDDVLTPRKSSDTEYLKRSDVLLGRYSIDRIIGRGVFGEAYLAQDEDQDGKEVAIKLYTKHFGLHSTMHGKLVNRFNKIQNVTNPSIVRHIGFYENVIGDVPGVIMEYIPGPTLSEFRQGRTIDEVGLILFIRRICYGLMTLHEGGLIHSDINPGNIILRRGALGSAVLIDMDGPLLGIARSDSTRRRSGASTYYVDKIINRYDAPENANLSQPVSAQTDIYSLGVTSIELLMNSDLIAASATGGYDPAQLDIYLKDLSPNIRYALRKMVEPHPRERFNSVSEILTYLPALPTDEPPIVPESKPAALNPIWVDQVLTLPREAVSSLLDDLTVEALLAALRTELLELGDDVSNESNIDPRASALILRVSSRIPVAAPNQFELFRLGHAEEILDQLGKMVVREWPDTLAARYLAVSLNFSRALSKFEVWRQFKASPIKEDLLNEQSDVVNAAGEIANELISPDAAEFVSPVIPEAIHELVANLAVGDQASSEGASNLAIISTKQDLLESVGNVLKAISSLALDYINLSGRGFADEARSRAPRDGAAAFKWLRRLIITSSGAVITGEFLLNLSYQYPQIFGWLGDVITFLSRVF